MIVQIRNPYRDCGSCDIRHGRKDLAQCQTTHEADGPSRHGNNCLALHTPRKYMWSNARQEGIGVVRISAYGSDPRLRYGVP
jgi:hypothetical protein